MAESPERDLSDHTLAVLISILNRVVDDAVMTALAAEFGDVGWSHGAVFEMLDPGGTHVAELARRARMTRQAMGELVEDLERLGYVERRPDPADRRAKLVMLTTKGEAALRDGIAAVADLEARWAACLGERETRAFRAALENLSLACGGEHIR
jgi:DNA-binding MarR family transcriptional regulator